jgi:Peroxidase
MVYANIFSHPIALFSLAASVYLVSGSKEECQKNFGPAPRAETCDTYTNYGSNVFLDNKPADKLNTEIDPETPAMIISRLLGIMPPQEPKNLEAKYNPVFDAYCFNEDYPVPSLTASQQNSLYLDYKTAFDQINKFTTDVSQQNNGVTNDRIPGMFLRMCFHDNAVDATQPDFQDYVASGIDPITKKWTAEARYLKTSGADASNLICPEERFHPNNNYDQTASRVLNSIQTVLKSKHKQMSYADLLHNGCNAAAIYLTGQSPSASLAKNPFTFGRKDACHADKKCTKKYPLCGPTELLPSVTLTAHQTNQWFASRGMSECLFMGLMWTHTTVDGMGSGCPLKRLPCTAGLSDVFAFKNKAKLFFKSGDMLDYFNFFLNRGTHQTLPDTGDDGNPNCVWTVDGRSVPWPMTGIDCTLGLDNVEKNGPAALATTIKNFGHNALYNKFDILQCALNVLGGKGGTEGGACNVVIPTECKSRPKHKFGGFYSTLPPSATVRVTVDPRCEEYGYRRRMLEVSSSYHVAGNHTECMDVEYDMFLVIEGAHFAALVTPTSNYTSSTFCPPIVLHSKSDKDQPMEKLMVVTSYADVAQMDEETKLHLGSRPLQSIINAFDDASVGLKGETKYNPISNNCVAMLRNMADPLDVKLDDRLVQFVTKRLLLSSADHMFEIIQDSPTLKMLYDSSNRFLKAVRKEDIISRLIKLYL